MKIKEIMKNCLKRKHMVIYRHGEDQWISDGFSVYLASGIPRLDEDGVQRLFDIPYRKWEKMSFSSCDGLPGYICFEDSDDSERELSISTKLIGPGGEKYLVAKTRKGVYFLDEDELKPLAFDNYTKIFERESTDGIYFAVKDGVFLRAVISPVNMATDEMAEEFREIAFGLQQVVREKNRETQLDIGEEDI